MGSESLGVPPLRAPQEGISGVWDIDSGKMTTGISNAHLGNVQSLALRYSGNFLFSGGEDGKIHMFDLNDRFSKGVVKPIFAGLSTWSRYYCLHLSFPGLFRLQATEGLH